MALHCKSGLIFFALAIFALAILGCALPAPLWGQASKQTPLPSGNELADPQLSGSINGTDVDGTGAVIAGARVRLTREGQSPDQEVLLGEALSGGDGEFSFANIAPGPFQLTTTAAGFATQASSGILHSGEFYNAPPIALAVATANTEVHVTVSRVEVAGEQIKEQEKQRVLPFIPNFFFISIPNAVALHSRQ